MNIKKESPKRSKEITLQSLEDELIPYHTKNPVGDRVVVLAPHPDDETLGCGGAIKRLLDLGKDVMVVFLTSGDKADPNNPLSKKYYQNQYHITEYSLMREKEAQRAQRILGVSNYIFLRFPDRLIHLHTDEVISNINDCIKKFNPDTLYSPSIIELNPDHRATARITMSYFEKGYRVVFYEVTVPLRPNILVDITEIKDIKESAINEYKSQTSLIDYGGFIFSLNNMRALTVSDSRYCEAFWLLEDVSDVYIREWLSYGIAINGGIV